MKRTAKIVLFVITIATLCFIWGNSMLPKSVSSGESGFVMKLISPILEIFVGKGNVTEHLVRKLAHFTEYSVLGVELALIFGIIKRKERKSVWCNYPMIIMHAVTLSFIDETIQIFSGRGPAIVDMWIDTVGAAIFSAIVLLILSIKNQQERKWSGKN